MVILYLYIGEKDKKINPKKNDPRGPFSRLPFAGCSSTVLITSSVPCRFTKRLTILSRTSSLLAKSLFYYPPGNKEVFFIERYGLSRCHGPYSFEEIDPVQRV